MYVLLRAKVAHTASLQELRVPHCRPQGSSEWAQVRNGPPRSRLCPPLRCGPGVMRAGIVRWVSESGSAEPEMETLWGPLFKKKPIKITNSELNTNMNANINHKF